MISFSVCEEMDYNNIFEEFMKSCGYNCSNKNNSTDSDDSDTENTPPGVADEECRCGNSDIPGGFQDLNPLLFVMIGEIIGDMTASKIPFNVQNALGNWLQLVGQAILTYNAQQQYFQGGPGRYYEPIYRNSANPFCENTVDESGANTPGNRSCTSSNSRSNVNSSNEANKNIQARIDKLESEIESLKKEIRKLNNR